MGTENSNLIILLQNYAFGEVTNTPGTPYPYFIYLPTAEIQQTVGKFSASTPLVDSAPFILDLGLGRYTASITMAVDYVLGQDRETFLIPHNGESRTFTQYSASELEDLFTIMKRDAQSEGHNWQLILYGKTNRIDAPSFAPVEGPRIYNCALTDSNHNYSCQEHYL